MKNQGFTDIIKMLAEEFPKGWGRIRSFSDKIGITEHQGRTLFKGQIPKWDTLLKIAQAYGKSVDWLLTGVDEMAEEKNKQPKDAEERLSYNHTAIIEPNDNMRMLLKKAQRVLNSETHTGASLALAQNIDTFDKAVSDHDALNTDINSSKKQSGVAEG